MSWVPPIAQAPEWMVLVGKSLWTLVVRGQCAEGPVRRWQATTSVLWGEPAIVFRRSRNSKWLEAPGRVAPH